MEHPGDLGAQDTYYVGAIKSLGRIYQQTFIDTYAKVALSKLHHRKNALVEAKMLNDGVLPFYEEKDVANAACAHGLGRGILRKPESHKYQLYLALENIDGGKYRPLPHARQITAGQGICERFHRTVQEEFYSLAFRTKLYISLEELQLDLDGWLRECKEERAHSGKYCFGKTPLQTFRDSAHLAQEKMLDRLTTAAPTDVGRQRAEPEL